MASLAEACAHLISQIQYEMKVDDDIKFQAYLDAALHFLAAAYAWKRWAYPEGDELEAFIQLISDRMRTRLPEAERMVFDHRFGNGQQ
jgi:hypothetical protein